MKRRRTYEEIHAERHPMRGVNKHVPAHRTSSGLRFAYDTTLVDRDEFEQELKKYGRKYDQSKRKMDYPG